MVLDAQIKKIQSVALTMRNSIVDTVGIGKVGHTGGSLSATDIVATLYFHKMNISPQDPKNKDRDRFLLSKGHVSLVQYVALAELGFFPKEELKNMKTLGSMLQGHPDMIKTPGIEAGTGSLGQGLSISNGMALAMKMDNSQGKVYVLIGDGELAEGQNWEAAMYASANNIDNLVAIVDKNDLQATGTTAERLCLGSIADKWRAFDWHVIEISGHDIKEIIEALDTADTIKGKPTAIIAKTIKGKGISFTENVVAFHNGMLTAEQHQIAKEELKIK